MSKVKEQITALLEREQYKEQFYHRKQKYHSINEYLPVCYENIVNENHPWFCHCLAFRIATYPTSAERLFERLNSLLEMVGNVEGWINESKNIGDLWSKNYDSFFHTLWMFQCIEYFKDRGNDVIFPSKKGKKSPDLKIITNNNDEFYVECYVYSKRWFVETFINDIINLLDPNLYLERVYNINLGIDKSGFNEILEDICNITNKSEIDKAKKLASENSPHIMYCNKGIKLLMEGEIGNKPNPNNAHGDPSFSANIYLNEIIKHKENKNDLSEHHPNCLMVNGLGVDFQNLFTSNRIKKLSYKSNNIDKLKIYACGIDKKLSECSYGINVTRIEH